MEEYPDEKGRGKGEEGRGEGKSKGGRRENQREREEGETWNRRKESSPIRPAWLEISLLWHTSPVLHVLPAWIRGSLLHEVLHKVTA